MITRLGFGARTELGFVVPRDQNALRRCLWLPISCWAIWAGLQHGDHSVDRGCSSSMPNSAPYSRQGLQRNKSGLGHAVSNGFVKWTALTQPNYAAVLHGINDMRYEEFPLASTLKEGTVRIEVKAVGICGSDVHYWKRVRLGHQHIERNPKV